MILAFVQTKGGTGKSTLTLVTAFSRLFGKAFASIGIVELDPQGTLQKWWQRREQNRRKFGRVGFAHIPSTDKAVIQARLEELEKTNELLILDVPGESLSKFHTQFACAVADVVLIPMRTSTNDEEAFEDNLLPIIEKILAVDPESRDVFHVIPSFIHPLANRGHILAYFREMLPRHVHCLDAVFSFGTVFENFSRGGNHLYDYARLVKTNGKLSFQAQKAIDEVETLAGAILQLR